MAIKKSDLYSSLWASCNELRGGMDASQYKDYVLFLLFIKYISDKYGNSDDFAPPVTIPPGLTYVLATMNLTQYSESSAQPGLSVSKILMLDLHAPSSKAEQTAIAAILSDMDTELATLQERRSKTQALKQAMMQELLTGQIRLVRART